MEANHKENKINDKLTIYNVRSTLGITIGQDLKNEGFSIDSKFTQLKKKIGKGNEIRISFDCYDYKPARIEFRLILVFVIKDIDDEAELFYTFCGEQYNKGWTIVLNEGDFHQKVKFLQPKFRNAATHIVTNNETLNEGIEDCRKVLREEIIPMLPKFSNLSEFQNFVLTNYDEILRLGIEVPSLIAAKLHSKEALIKLVDYLWNKLGLELKSDLHIMKKLVGNIIRFSDEKSSLTTN